MLGEFSRHQPSTFKVGVDHVVPIGLGVLEQRLRDNDTGIVDQDRQRPKLGLGRGNRGGDTVGPGHIAGDRQALSARRLDLAGGLGEAIDPPRGERHLGAGGGEQLGEVATDPARSAGHERHLAREVEARQSGHESRPLWAISLARSRSSNFWILPVEVFGNGPKTTVRGTL